MKNRAASFMEYTIVFGIISAVLIGMNTYIKRGIQGKLRDMTNYFISNQHVTEINPTSSRSDTLSNTTTITESFIGGGTRLNLTETKNVSSTSRVEEKSPYSTPFIPPPPGDGVQPPPYPEN